MRLQLEADGFWSPAFEYEAGEREAPVVLRLYKAGQVVGPTSALKPAETGPETTVEVRLRVLETVDDSLSLPDWAKPPLDLPCKVKDDRFSCTAPAGKLSVEILSGDAVLFRSRRLRVPAGQRVLLGD